MFRTFAGRDMSGIDTAHLARADTDRCAIFHIDDGVGFDVFAHRERKHEIVDFLVTRCALGGDRQFIAA